MPGHSFASRLCFELFVGDTFVRRVHIHHDQTVAVLSQDVDAVKLGNCVAKRWNVRVWRTERWWVEPACFVAISPNRLSHTSHTRIEG